MKNGFFASVSALLVAATSTFAQAPPNGTPPAASPSTPSPSLTAPARTTWHAWGTPSPAPIEPVAPTSEIWSCPKDSCQNQFWIGADYLLWWIKNAPLPVSVLTTTSMPDVPPAPGGLGQPGTTSLYGGRPVSLGAFSGMRLTAGGWFDGERSVGMEASAFLLEQRTASISPGSDAAGHPFLGFPYLDTVSGTETAFPVTFPPTVNGSFSTGSVVIANSSRLWGTEVNGVFNVSRADGVAVDFLAGLRYLNLQESLSISGSNFQTDFSAGTSTLASTTVDYFGTRNQFFGGQVGARFNWAWQNFCLSATGKIAMGQTHQVVNANGNTQIPVATGIFTGAPPFSVGALYTQPTNIGRFSANPFTVIPELQFKIGYAFTSQWVAYVGYDVLYWGNVMRPGDQVDHVVNSSQIGGFGLVGPTRPEPLLRQSDFWAQGISFGVQFSF